MEKLKFFIATLIVVFATQAGLAVTLPSTSYTSTSGMIDNGEVYTVSSGARITGSFLSLGDYPNCKGKEGQEDPETHERIECSTCCIQYGNPYIEGQKAAYDACMSECKDGDSTELGYEEPLDESDMLLFLICLTALGFATIRGKFNRRA